MSEIVAWLLLVAFILLAVQALTLGLPTTGRPHTTWPQLLTLLMHTGFAACQVLLLGIIGLFRDWNVTYRGDGWFMLTAACSVVLCFAATGLTAYRTWH